MQKSFPPLVLGAAWPYPAGQEGQEHSHQNATGSIPESGNTRAAKDQSSGLWREQKDLRAGLFLKEKSCNIKIQEIQLAEKNNKISFINQYKSQESKAELQLRGPDGAENLIIRKPKQNCVTKYTETA